MAPELKKEQKASGTRPRYRYSLAANGFFLSMDLITGKKTTLPKVKLIEIPAGEKMKKEETRDPWYLYPPIPLLMTGFYAVLTRVMALINNEQAQERGALLTWAEVFRRIGLDERDHMNMSFMFCNKPECVAAYDGRPVKPGLIHARR